MRNVCSWHQSSRVRRREEETSRYHVSSSRRDEALDVRVSNMNVLVAAQDSDQSFECVVRGGDESELCVVLRFLSPFYYAFLRDTSVLDAFLLTDRRSLDQTFSLETRWQLRPCKPSFACPTAVPDCAYRQIKITGSHSHLAAYNKLNRSQQNFCYPSSAYELPYNQPHTYSNVIFFSCNLTTNRFYWLSSFTTHTPHASNTDASPLPSRSTSGSPPVMSTIVDWVATRGPMSMMKSTPFPVCLLCVCVCIVQADQGHLPLRI